MAACSCTGMIQRLDSRFALLAFVVLSGACMPQRVPNLGEACVENDGTCRQSFCNGSWRTEARCDEDDDCPGYVAKAQSYNPPAANQRCIEHRCHQVGQCSNHHS